MVRENKIPTRDKRGKRPSNKKESKFYKLTIGGVPIKNDIMDISFFLKLHAKSQLHQHAIKLFKKNELQSNDGHPGSCNPNEYVCVEEDSTQSDAMILEKCEFKSEDVIELAYKQEPL